MTALFLSYRRADSPDTVKLIHERLKQRLRGWDVFYDHQSIPQGEPFPELLRAKLMSATAVLVVIGPQWLEILQQRATIAGIDHVRAEVRIALEAGCTVVPVTVGNARLPSEADLTDFPDLLPLLKRNGREVRPDPLFDADIARIIEGLKPLGPDTAIGTTLDDKYTLTAAIGEGGMGVVYLAQQRQPVQRTVAVKLIKPGMDSRDVLARFDAERQALAVMDHPNIAKVLDAGVASSGRPYFVMEHVKGVSITDYCDAKKLSPQERINLFITVCNAVQHAHQKGIIHRDLKPSNVLVEVVDGKPVPKVIDFGLAKALGHKLTDMTLHTAAETRVGTLEHSAPEQAAGRSFDVDTRSDIYSLGVLLYELLTGAPPFTRAELLKVGEEEMRRVIREVEPTKPSKKLSSSGELPAIAANRQLEPGKLTRLVQGDLDWIVMKCLEKENARRYETANQLGQELQRFLADEPVQAGPPSARYRLKKFLRRNKGPVLAAGLVLLALILGIVSTSIFYFQAEIAREDEAIQRKLADTSKLKALDAAAQEHEAKLVAEKATEKALVSAKAEAVARADAEQATKNALAAAAKERQASTLAVERLKQIEKANRLLENVFADIDPRLEQKGGPLLVEQLTKRLAEVAAKLDEEEIGDPLTTARLQIFLGSTLQSLGDAISAVSLHTKARAARERILGPDHPDTLTSMNNLASAYDGAGQSAKALPLYEETLAKRKVKLGPDHPATLTSMNNLAGAYGDAGQSAKALPLYEETLAKMKAKLGPDHPNTLTSVNNLAVAYERAGQSAKALPLYEETLAKQKAKLGPDHPASLLSMSNLAAAYWKDGQLAKALPLLEETLAKQKAKLGPDHPATLISMNNLAVAYKNDGQLDKALPLYEETLAKRKAKLGPDHPDTLISMNNLAFAYSNHGKLDKALPLYEETLAKMKAKLSPDHPSTLTTMGNLALAYFAAKDPVKAVPFFNEYLEVRRKQWGGDDPRFASQLALFGLDLFKYEQFAAAEPMLRECLDIRTKKQPDLWSTFNTKAMLGTSLLGQKKYVEAEPLLKEGYEGMKQREKMIPPAGMPRISEALERLVQFYVATGDAVEAERWRKELAARKAAEKSQPK